MAAARPRAAPAARRHRRRGVRRHPGLHAARLRGRPVHERRRHPHPAARRPRPVEPPVRVHGDHADVLATPALPGAQSPGRGGGHARLHAPRAVEEPGHGGEPRDLRRRPRPRRGRAGHPRHRGAAASHPAHRRGALRRGVAAGVRPRGDRRRRGAPRQRRGAGPPPERARPLPPGVVVRDRRDAGHERGELPPSLSGLASRPREPGSDLAPAGRRPRDGAHRDRGRAPERRGRPHACGVHRPRAGLLGGQYPHRVCVHVRGRGFLQTTWPKTQNFDVAEDNLLLGYLTFPRHSRIPRCLAEPMARNLCRDPLRRLVLPAGMHSHVGSMHGILRDPDVFARLVRGQVTTSHRCGYRSGSVHIQKDLGPFFSTNRLSHTSVW